jgi:signal transduction histidine kinase
MRHLLENAVKFSNAGGSVEVTARTLPRAGEPPTPAAGAPRERAGWIEIAVSDTGLGIAPALLPRLFEPFWQADGSSRRRHGGSGIGLALVRRIVEGHGGRVGVRSTPGRGSTFTVHLPLRPRGAEA